MISNLLGNFIFSNLLDPPPQAARSVARATLHIIFLVILSTPSLGSCIYQAIPKDGIGSCHHPYASFMWMQIGIKYCQGKASVFLCKQQQYMSHP